MPNYANIFFTCPGPSGQSSLKWVPDDLGSKTDWSQKYIASTTYPITHIMQTFINWCLRTILGLKWYEKNQSCGAYGVKLNNYQLIRLGKDIDAGQGIY